MVCKCIPIKHSCLQKVFNDVSRWYFIKKEMSANSFPVSNRIFVNQPFHDVIIASAKYFKINININPTEISYVTYANGYFFDIGLTFILKTNVGCRIFFMSSE